MDNISIWISALALTVAALALGWNIYRDVVLRARVRARLSVVRLVTAGESFGQAPQYISLSITNLGPGPVEITGIGGKVASHRDRAMRRVSHFVLTLDHSNPLSARVPRRLEVGQTANYLFPHKPGSFLSTDATHIGVHDSFGRMHFAPLKEVLAAKRQHTKDFPDDKSRLVGQRPDSAVPD